MRTKFQQWVESKKSELEAVSVAMEYVMHKNPDERRIPDPSTGVIYESERCLGQVIVWKSRQMEYEVVNIDSEEMILWKYIGRLPDEPDFNEILKQFFDVLQTGLKP
ncbi:immunity protein TriTu family protein [Cohnella cholangitidis]|uniref:Uncharacterized protein n=1 Tax=Cohnella cholangitidis TaxID=2598458 RepID=A0A7G5BWI3_9BACL|nr:hypothetical protein [Cohnella cholangitidis]QMV41317.1 hypothetical protein FPL14_09015 [Cohnella cholangitidis]